jgi:hypothetical protein
MRKNEYQNESLKQTIDKCGEICNQIRILREDLDDDGFKGTRTICQTKEETLVETLQIVLREKQEQQVFIFFDNYSCNLNILKVGYLLV